MQVSPVSRSPCGPSSERCTSPASASSVWLVVMFEVAFSRLMCCSRVCRVSTIAALARGVDRLADDPAGQPADVVVARGEEAVVRAAVAHRVAGRLALADRHRAAVVARRLEHAEADQVDVRDRQRAGLVRRRGELGRRLEAAEEVRLLEDHGGRVLRGLAHAVGIGRAAVVRHLDDLEPEAARVGLHDLAHLRVRRLGDDDLRRGRSRASRRSTRRRRRSCRRSRTRSRRPCRSARRSRSGTRRSPAARPGYISGWYGVYAVRNSPRCSTASTTAGT